MFDYGSLALPDGGPPSAWSCRSNCCRSTMQPRSAATSCSDSPASDMTCSPNGSSPPGPTVSHVVPHVDLAGTWAPSAVPSPLHTQLREAYSRPPAQSPLARLQRTNRRLCARSVCETDQPLFVSGNRLTPAHRKVCFPPRHVHHGGHRRPRRGGQPHRLGQHAVVLPRGRPDLRHSGHGRVPHQTLHRPADAGSRHDARQRPRWCIG